MELLKELGGGDMPGGVMRTVAPGAADAYLVALREFGAEIDSLKNVVTLEGRPQLKGRELEVPGDLSSAAFFLCAAGLFPESHVTLPGILMNPTRARLLDILIIMGLRISVAHLEENVAAAKLKLTPDEWKAIEALAS